MVISLKHDIVVLQLTELYMNISWPMIKRIDEQHADVAKNALVALIWHPLERFSVSPDYCLLSLASSVAFIYWKKKRVKRWGLINSLGNGIFSNFRFWENFRHLSMRYQPQKQSISLSIEICNGPGPLSGPALRWAIATSIWFIIDRTNIKHEPGMSKDWKVINAN